MKLNTTHHGKRVGARNSKHVLPYAEPYRADKITAIKGKIPKFLRMYAKQYGSSVDEVIRNNKRWPS